ncbi:M24 family metallopeptidase, partial [Mycobacterium tuberculosis]|nr:M24 family metallopeptidase [Mycobacterium tuberculosis]
SLYTADITRTLPVSGTFTEVQAKIYDAVLEASDAAFAVAAEHVDRPVRFREVHEAAMKVIAHRLEEFGLLPVSAEESLSPEGQ